MSLTLRLSLPGVEPHAGTVPEPTYGDQLQILGIALTEKGGLSPGDGAAEAYGPVAEGFGEVAYGVRRGRYADGEAWELRVPSYSIRDLAYGPLHPDTPGSHRASPRPCRAWACWMPYRTRQSLHSGGSRGRRRRRHLRPRQPGLGPRRKAHRTRALRLEGLTADPSAAGRGGVPQRYRHYERAVSRRKPARRNRRRAATPGTAGGRARRTRSRIPPWPPPPGFCAWLPVPKRRKSRRPGRAQGPTFVSPGSAARPVTSPRHVTGEVAGFPELSNQVIWPYTDLLLHDMGEGLADDRREFEATGREWRTPPLWGPGLEQADFGPRVVPARRPRPPTLARPFCGTAARLGPLSKPS